MRRQPTTIWGRERSYRVGELVGQGQFGKVYRVRPDGSLPEVAVKIIRRNKFTRNGKLQHLLEREIEVLSGLRHPSVIEFHELVVEDQEVYLFYEFCEGGSLEDRLTMSESDLLPVAEQVVAAMGEAEKRGVIHRDIKPANILFKEGKVKIADWGFSRLLGEGETTCSFIGSPAYMAPEVLKGQEYTIKADMWSLGVVLYETLTGLCPWRAKSVNALHS